jgi:glycosyltransferase involved in cell wall biosynthesis
VRFAGFRRDVHRFYSIADVFVLPSLYEGFGQVFLEAMASGIPCIGVRSDYPKVIVASEEVIVEGKTGFCVDPYSTSDLAESIVRVIRDDDVRRQMSRNARELCELKYSWSSHVQRVKRVFGQEYR